MNAKTWPSGAQPATRERLLLASLKAFGSNDYGAVSTREIVELADANISAISYHFGGKEQLYLATAAFLAESIRNDQRDAVADIESRFNPAHRGDCRAQLAELVSSLADNVLAGELSEDAAGFIFREQLHPTAAFDILYRELIEPIHDLYGRLLACALDAPVDAREVRLMTHALLGQIMIFRLGQATILRRLAIPAFTADDIHAIKHRIVANTLAALDARLEQET